MPGPRVWFLNESGTRLIQAQNDRFVVNWRKKDEDEEYPRFPALREALKNEFAQLQEFLHDEALPEPEPDQAELTYVNHILAGAEPGVTRQPLAQFVRLWAGEPPNAAYLSVPEGVDFECTYQVTGEEHRPLGRLHVKVESQLRRVDNMPIYGMTLVARGTPGEHKVGSALALMGQQHRWIVQTFADITTPEMHDFWGRVR